VIDPRFVYLAVALTSIGSYGYIRDTLRGSTSPNRVSWGLWGIEGLLAFAVEIQQHVGLASIMTLMLGLVPWLVVLASFKNSHSVWRIGRFDVFCAMVSVLGLVSWFFIKEPTVALMSFVAADQIAVLPTLRKSWIAPETESPLVFAVGVVTCGVTMLTLKHVTTAGALFPGCVFVSDFIIANLVFAKIGTRARARRRATVGVA